jgi:hypothetical protein
MRAPSGGPELGSWFGVVTTSSGKFVARLRLNGQLFSLCHVSDAVLAARAVDEACSAYRGKRPNWEASRAHATLDPANDDPLSKLPVSFEEKLDEIRAAAAAAAVRVNVPKPQSRPRSPYVGVYFGGFNRRHRLPVWQVYFWQSGADV